MFSGPRMVHAEKRNKAMLVKIEIVNTENEETLETHYIETDSVNRALQMFDDSETTDVRYHVMDADEERKYHAKNLNVTLTGTFISHSSVWTC